MNRVRGFVFPVLAALFCALTAPRGGLDAQVVLLDFGATWKFFRGTQPPSSPDPNSWREPGFNDLSWEEGPLGIGYGDGDDTTILTDMMQIADDPLTVEDESQPGYTTVFLRQTFNVANPASLSSLLLTADYDDGFVCYLNGVEAGRVNAGVAGADLAFDAVAGAAAEPTRGFVDLTAVLPELVAGENLIAVQVLNVNLTSSDLSFNARVSGNDPSGSCPTGLLCDVGPAAISLSWTSLGAYDSVRVTRDGADIAGSPFPGSAISAIDNAPGDFVNHYEVTAAIGAFTCPPITCDTLPPATALIDIGEEWLFFRGLTAPSDPPTAWRETGFDDGLWEEGPTGIGYADGDDATELTDMINSYVSYYCRKTFTVSDLAGIGSLTLEIDYDDGFVAYLNDVEVARSASMGAAGTEFTFDQVCATREAGTVEVFVLPVAGLRAGSNLLAVEIHNTLITSTDASFIPRLLARSAGPSGNNRPTARIRITPGSTVRLAAGAASVTLDGATSDDGDGGAQGLTYAWTKVSGPAGDAIVSPAAASTAVNFTAAGSFRYQLLVNDAQASNNTDVETADITVLPEGGAVLFRRGDVDGSGALQITDGVQLFNYLFLGGNAPRCFDTADSDDTGNLNLTDGVRILNFLFLGGAVIPDPGPTGCGSDPTPDPLDCVEYTP
jgi:hypothetical protein